MRQDSLTLHVLDVGQGDSILLRFPSGRWGVIDCNRKLGQAEAPALTRLKEETKNGLTELEFVLLTHPDLDHYRGLADLLEYFSVDGRNIREFWRYGVLDAKTREAWITAGIRNSKSRNIQKSLQSQHQELARIVEWFRRKIPDFKDGKSRWVPLFGPNLIPGLPDGIHAYCLAPSGTTAIRTERDVANRVKFDTRIVGDANRVSTIVLFVYGETSLLFGGDAPIGVWEEAIPAFRRLGGRENWPDLASGFVKVSHHGAKGSSSFELWTQIADVGAIAAISAGHHAQYDHPDEETLDHISKSGREIEIFCTGLASSCQRRLKRQVRMSRIGPRREYVYRIAMVCRPAPVDGSKRCCGDMRFSVDARKTIKPDMTRRFLCQFPPQKMGSSTQEQVNGFPADRGASDE